jgi:hypothetical protein
MADYLQYWLAAYVSDLKPTTARGYESAVRLHLIPALGTKRLDGLQVQHVKGFMDDSGASACVVRTGSTGSGLSTGGAVPSAGAVEAIPAFDNSSSFTRFYAMRFSTLCGRS